MRKKVRISEVLRTIIIIVALSFFVFPIYWLFATSLKIQVDIFSMPPKWVFSPTIANYFHVFFNTDLPRLGLNSFITALLNVVLSLVVGTMAAYGISRYKVGGQKLLFWFLSIRMLPPIVATIPLFIIAASLRLVDTKIILPILYLILNIPFVVWMMKSFIDEIPESIEESALIDGCSHWGILGRIVLPLAAPGLVATGVICFIFAWNEFLLAMIFTRSPLTQTLPVGISGFITEEMILWGYITASASIAAVPPLILALIFQRYMVRGLSFGAVKA
ncbi:MAG TPA: carbohydrate ABC transporter permease [Atribacteraceae bacterium]|nr:carbohydrate ABC transporter permease [Atribacteraceae bacterium]